MAIDSEDILICLWRFLSFFIKTSQIFAHKFPFVSCILILSFFVYLFFNLLLYHLPFFLFVAFLLRLFWTSEPQSRNDPDSNLNEIPTFQTRPINPRPIEDRELSSLIRQKSRRTHFAKNRTFVSEPSFERGQSSNATHSNEATNDNSLDEDDEDDEEDRRDRRKNRAVEWTEDDRRNVVDLGISEMERNRRLESLMAKRRARKLPKLPRARAAITSGSDETTTSLMAPIFVARNPLEVVDGGCGELEVPGSAPSVLFPAKNPFDIPYDPTEEKPDLMKDSFQAEFGAVINQKETMVFCRHESFCLGSFHPFGNERRESANFGPRGFGGLPGNEQILGDTQPHLVVQDGSQSLTHVHDSNASKLEGETDTATNDTVSDQDVLNDMESASNLDARSTITEVDTEPSLLEDSETTSSSSFELPNRADQASNTLEPRQHYAHEDKNDTIPTTIEPQYDSSSTASERSKSICTDDGLFFRESLAIHTPSCSIASDLQVEVSEIGSPPLTHGNMSSIDGDSLSFDEEMERSQLLNFGIESFDGTNRGVDEVGMSRDLSSYDALVGENQETIMQLTENFASHSFFEAVYEKIEALSPRDKSAEEYDRDSVTDRNPTEETELGSTTQFEHLSLDLLEPIIEESEASFTDQNSDTQQDSLLEEVNVNQSSPSSPTSTPIERLAMDEAFSSNLDEDHMQNMDVPIVSDQEVESVLNSSLLDRSSLDRPRNGQALAVDSPNLALHTGNFETFQEPFEAEKMSDETSIVLNISETLTVNKLDIDEFELNKSGEEIPETPADIENGLETLGEELENLWSKVPE